MDALSAWRGRRVLVTGASGFIGRRVRELGEREGIDVVAVSGTSSARSSSGHARTVDLRDADAVDGLVREVRPAGVLHLAAAGVRPGTTTLADLLAINALGTAHLLAAVERHGAGPVVLAGSGYEYAPQERPLSEDDAVDPRTPYGASKAAASVVAAWHAQRHPVTLLRLFNVYGIGERPPRLLPSIVAAAQRGEPIELTACTQVRDFVDADDVASLFWCALAAPPGSEQGTMRTLNVGSGRPAPLREFVECIARALCAHGLRPELRFGARPMRPGEPTVYVADVRRLHATLPWRPRTSLEEGITRAVGRML